MRHSWVPGANEPKCDFPLANLPYGVFSTPGSAPRCGVAIGDSVIDLAALSDAGLLGAVAADCGFEQDSINSFMEQGRAVWDAIRAGLTELLAEDGSPALRDNARLRDAALLPLESVSLHLPFRVGGYTDFFAGRQHAVNSGTILRGANNALTPNWPHMPIAYNGRASSVVVSGTPVRRPLGQFLVEGEEGPHFGPSRRLDIEVEFGAVVGTSTAHGDILSVAEAHEHIFGFVLLNDWSARDIQRWEGQPLGPFQSKATATTISPWVVPQAALAAFRVPSPERDVPLLPYLQEPADYCLDINIEAWLGAGAVEPARLVSTNTRHLYYSAPQLLAHHAISGCRMQVGDLLGSGTISGPERRQFGCMMEQSWGGRDPIQLENGLERIFLEDGDSVRMTGWAQGEGYRIGFGSCDGQIMPAHAWPKR
ncbi:fumarylacetoacetase [Devosia sp. A449]